MQAYPLTVLSGGINRLRVKGAASRAQLYDLLNAFITNAGSISPREGTIRVQTLNSSTVGLVAVDGVFNVFSNTLQSVPSGYTCNVLKNPANPSLAPTKIWYAKPFMGFLYVVAQFSDGSIYDYWLQNNGTWAANTVYSTGNIVLPPTATGLAYQAVRDFPAQSLWTAETITSAGTIVEPNTYTGFAYKAIAVVGTSPHTSSTEPTWPTVAGGIIQEFGDFDTSATDAGTYQGQTTDTLVPLGSNITDRYGDSSDISGSTSTAGAAITITSAQTKVTIWTAGTKYAPGAVVQPSKNQGAYVGAIPNGDFENGNDGNWIFSGATLWGYSTSGQYQGSYCLAFPTGNTAGSYAMMNTYGAVKPGQSVTATCYLNPNNNGSDLSLWVVLEFFDATMTVIGSYIQGNVVQGSGYQKGSVTATAPANAAYVKAGIEAGSGTNSRNTGYADLISWNLEQPASISNFIYEAVMGAPASSGSTEPTWPTTAGNTVIDGGVTWEAIGTSIITWQAIPLMKSGATAPSFPTTVGVTVSDPSTFTDQNGVVIKTSMSWIAINRSISDTNHPNTLPTVIGASHVFKGDIDICPYSAAVDPTDWTSSNNAGYLPTGLNDYGNNPVAMLALYRSNLMAFNSGGYQMWQIDPDPANMALLDAQPVGSIWPRAAQSVANDLLFLTEVGVRNLGTVGATANMAIGNTGQPVDPLVVAQLQAGTYDPLSLYYPGRGQYWLIFGPQAFVLTINGSGQKTWSRYVFPAALTDWTLSNGVLYLRTSTNLVWQFDAQTLVDDLHPISVLLLLHFDGTNGQTSTVDSSGKGNVISNNSSAYLTTYSPKFGTASAYFPSQQSSAFTAPITGGSTLDILQESFTVSFWFNTLDDTLTGAQLWGTGGEGINYEVACFLTSPGTVELFAYWNGTVYSATATLATLNDGNWHNIVCMVTSSQMGVAIDGVWGTLQTYAYSPDPSPTTTFQVGVYYGDDGGGGSYIDEFIVVAGNLFTLGTAFTPASAAYSIPLNTYTPFDGVIQWPYLDMGPLGINKMLVGVDLVGDGDVTVQIGFNQTDKTSFDDNAGFATSSSVTTAYTISMADTVPGEPIPIPLNAASYSLILTFGPNQAWTWEAANLYLAPQSGGGSTG